MIEEMKDLAMTTFSEIEYNHIEELAKSQLVEQIGCKPNLASILP